MIKELFESDLIDVLQNGSIGDISDFYAALYHKESVWANPYFGETYQGDLSVTRHTGSLKVRGIRITPNGESFIELQDFINYAYQIGKPIALWQADPNALFYYQRAGVYLNVSSTLIASDGTVLATGLNTDAAWLNAWNTLRTPYERDTLHDRSFPYLISLAPLGELAGSFRYTQALP